MNPFHNSLDAFWNSFLNRNSLLPYPLPIDAFPAGFAALHSPHGSHAPPLPYITYELAMPAFGDSSVLAGRIWSRSSSWSLVDDVLSQAAEKIPIGGISLSSPHGSIALFRSNPFTSYLPPVNDDPLIKAAVIRIFIKSFLL